MSANRTCISWPVGWDRDLGGVFSGRGLRAQPRYNGASGKQCDIDGQPERGAFGRTRVNANANRNFRSPS
jgi:hypothetical protein